MQRQAAERIIAERRLRFAHPYGVVEAKLSPDALEVGKYRGYLPPERLLGIIERIDQAAAEDASSDSPGIAVNELPGAMKHALEQAERRLERVLTSDPGTGVMRHADAGYPRAIQVARERGVRVPMLQGD